MKQEVYKDDFHDAFREMNRDNNFSFEGKDALFEYLEEYEDSTGEAVELDIIALCCEYTEYEDLKEFWGNYSKSEYPDLETIRDHTQVIEVGKEGFIIQNF